MTRYEKFKGKDAPVVIPQLKFSTDLNALIQSDFAIEKVVGTDVPIQMKNIELEISHRYYSLHKVQKFPTTMIFKER